MDSGMTERAAPELLTQVTVPMRPAEAFDLILRELRGALSRQGITVEWGPEGRVRQGALEVGSVREWSAGRRVVLQWRSATWRPDAVSNVELRFEPFGGGTRAIVLHHGFGVLLGSGEEVAGWFARDVAAPLLAAIAPQRFGDWLTDRLARAPSGDQARATYRDPIYHYPNFRVILAELDLAADDYLIEVGCGGGALLREALRSGCRAAAVDHSPEMVELAREQNAAAIAEGRLDIRWARADELPFGDDIFTCAAMTGVLGFLPDPVAALAELRRVLRRGGRLVVMGSDPELRGTPAAPEPFASRLRFYGDEELRQIAVDAGFDSARVVRRDLEPFARESGVPEEHVSLFSGPGARFIIARR